MAGKEGGGSKRKERRKDRNAEGGERKERNGLIGEGRKRRREKGGKEEGEGPEGGRETNLGIVWEKFNTFQDL